MLIEYIKHFLPCDAVMPGSAGSHPPHHGYWVIGFRIACLPAPGIGSEKIGGRVPISIKAGIQLHDIEEIALRQASTRMPGTRRSTA